MYREILLNGPNIVGYVRLMLVFTGCLFFNNTVFITFVSLSAILDMFDGYLARKWNQETRFGSFRPWIKLYYRISTVVKVSHSLVIIRNLLLGEF
ncbi:uncharacterized protein [Clytia hemisphaerica]|uniref:uncharacterized protein isoform X1 n=1 Tax=Clytia hemisphaerica TaxID=252671 RepID=UPI0034D5491D